jgi:histone deacetylase 1/2
MPTQPTVPSTAATAPSGHRMQTQAKSGIHMPNLRYALTSEPTSATISPIPKSVRSALQDPNWRAAMAAEHDALQHNRTWRLVDRPPGANVVTGKWIFKHKLNPDGTLERYKARWVVRGFTQRAGIDFGEPSLPVADVGCGIRGG